MVVVLLACLACLAPASASSRLQLWTVSPAQLSAAMLAAADSEPARAQCGEDLQRWEAALDGGELWAVEMADAWTKSVPGMFHGNTIDFGDFDECIQVSSGSEHANVTDSVIRGAYFLQWLQVLPTGVVLPPAAGSALLRLQELLPLTLRMGVCVPDSCPEDLVVAGMQALADSWQRQPGLAGSVQVNAYWKNRKQTQDSLPRPTAVHWVVMAVFIFLFLLAVSATIVDQNLERLDLDSKAEARGRWRQLLCFSLVVGWRRLLAPAPPGSLQSINGIRVLSTVWIILGHVAEFFPPVSNQLDFDNVQSSLAYMLLYNYSLAVDTFLAVGGLVCGYTFLRGVERKRFFNWFEYIIHRYVRITPAMAVLTAFGATWYTMFEAGPDSHVFGFYSVYGWFQKYWWTNLAYVGNYFKDDNMVYVHTWYLSLDMQMYVLAPIILIPLWKRPLVGQILLFVVLVVSALLPGGLSLPFRTKDAYGLGIAEYDQQMQARYALYFPTHSRMSPYLVGIFAGYFLHRFRRDGFTFKFSRVHATLMWLLSAGAALSVVLGTYSLKIHSYNAVVSFLYVGFSKMAWSMSIVLVIIACETGCGGPVKKILSWGPFGPMSKLCFAIYLVHFLLVVWEIAQAHTVMYFTVYRLISSVTFITGVTLPFATLLFLVVEQPFILWEADLWRRIRRQKSTK